MVRRQRELTRSEKFQIALEQHRERIAAGSVTSEHMQEFLIESWRYFKSGWHNWELEQVLEKTFGEVPAWHGRADDNIEGLA